MGDRIPGNDNFRIARWSTRDSILIQNDARTELRDCRGSFVMRLVGKDKRRRRILHHLADAGGSIERIKRDDDPPGFQNAQNRGDLTRVVPHQNRNPISLSAAVPQYGMRYTVGSRVQLFIGGLPGIRAERLARGMRCRYSLECRWQGVVF